MGKNAQETRKEECAIPWEMVCRCDLIADAVKKKIASPFTPFTYSCFPFHPMPSTVKIRNGLVSRGDQRFRSVILAPGKPRCGERFAFFGQPGLSCELLPTSKHCPKERSVIETRAVCRCAQSRTSLTTWLPSLEYN